MSGSAFRDLTSKKTARKKSKSAKMIEPGKRPTKSSSIGYTRGSRSGARFSRPHAEKDKLMILCIDGGTQTDSTSELGPRK